MQIIKRKPKPKRKQKKHALKHQHWNSKAIFFKDSFKHGNPQHPSTYRICPARHHPIILFWGYAVDVKATLPSDGVAILAGVFWRSLSLKKTRSAPLRKDGDEEALLKRLWRRAHPCLSWTNFVVPTSPLSCAELEYEWLGYYMKWSRMQLVGHLINLPIS